jgi:hypothetical protein
MVDVYGFNPPAETYQALRFHSMDTYNYPKNKWTNGLIKMVKMIDSDWFILLLEDYWLTQRANLSCIEAMIDYATNRQGGLEILRIDLSADRASRKQAREYDRHSLYNIIVTPSGTPYQMSYQAALWNSAALLDVLKPDESAWESEVKGSKRLDKRDDLLVLGTSHYPIKYVPGYRSQQRRLHHMERMPQPHRKRVVGMVPASALR